MANFGLNGFGFPYSYNQQSTTTTNYFYGASSGNLTEPAFTELTANDTFLAGDLTLLGTDGKAYALTDSTLFDSYFANKPIAEVGKYPIRSGQGSYNGAAILSNDNIAYMVYYNYGFYISIYDKLGNLVLNQTYYPQKDPTFSSPSYTFNVIQSSISIHALPAGNFIVNFQGYTTIGGYSYYARYYTIISNSGGVVVDTTRLTGWDTNYNGGGSQYQQPATVTLLAGSSSGSFAISFWKYLSTIYLDTYVFNSSFSQIGSSSTVNAIGGGLVTSCALSDGKYVVGLGISNTYYNGYATLAYVFSSSGSLSQTILSQYVYQGNVGTSSGFSDPGHSGNGAYLNVIALSQGGFAFTYGYTYTGNTSYFVIYTSDNSLSVVTHTSIDSTTSGYSWNGISSVLSPFLDGGMQLSWTVNSSTNTMKFDRYGNIVGSKNPLQQSTYLNAIRSIDDAIYLRSFGTSGTEYIYKISNAGMVIGTYQDLSPSVLNKFFATNGNMLVLTNGSIQVLLNTAVSSRIPIGVAQNDAVANSIVTVQILGTSRTRITFPKSYSMDFSRNTPPGQNMYIVGNRAIMYGLLPTTINKTQIN